MMPVELIQCGPRHMKNGIEVTPMAEIRTCEGCGRDAPFGVVKNGVTLPYCGWRDGEPVCRAVNLTTSGDPDGHADAA